jgi:hypothetical protein
MKILLALSSIIGFASATKVYCDFETIDGSIGAISPIGITIGYNFNCNNDHNHSSETGGIVLVVQTFLPCSGCNEWTYSKHGGYGVNPKQSKDKPQGITWWLMWNGKECNTHSEGPGGSFRLECNV